MSNPQKRSQQSINGGEFCPNHMNGDYPIPQQNPYAGEPSKLRRDLNGDYPIPQQNYYPGEPSKMRRDPNPNLQHNYPNGEPGKIRRDLNGESSKIRRESVIMARNNPYVTDMDERNGNTPPRESRM